MAIDAERAAIQAYQEKHAECDIQQHPWQAVFGAGFDAGTAYAATERFKQAAKIDRLRAGFEEIRGLLDTSVRMGVGLNNVQQEIMRIAMVALSTTAEPAEQATEADRLRAAIRTALDDLVGRDEASAVDGLRAALGERPS